MDEVIVLLMFMEFSGFMAVLTFIEWFKVWEKNNPKSRVKSKDM